MEKERVSYLRRMNNITNFSHCSAIPLLVGSIKIDDRILPINLVLIHLSQMLIGFSYLGFDTTFRNPTALVHLVNGGWTKQTTIEKY